jgi:hypothetical protein
MATAGYGTVVYGGLVYGGQILRSPYAGHIRPFTDYAMRIIADTPIAYWRMDEMSEGSVVDNSGFNRHLEYTGAVDMLNPPLVAGGQSKYFDTTDYASTTIGGFLVNGREANGFSLEAWVRTDGTPSTERLIAGRANDGVFVVQDGFEFRLVSNDGITYKVKYTVATWERTYHVVATFSGGQMSLYVNGEYGDSTPFFGEFTNTSNTFYVGGSELPAPQCTLTRWLYIKRPCLQTLSPSTIPGECIRFHTEILLLPKAARIGDLTHHRPQRVLNLAMISLPAR